MPRVWSVASLAVSLLAGTALAQESRGSIGGLVRDASAAAVPGVSVTAVNADTHLEVRTVSDAAGSYSLLYLPAGRYTLTAELAGFKKIARAGIEVRVGDRLTLNLRLEPGEVRETVEVTASTPLLDAATGSAGQVVDAKRIQLLPLSDGNPFVLSRLAPGASYTGDLKFSRPFDNAGTSSITVDGAAGGNEFSLDGTPNMTHGRRVAYVPPTDAVEEFKVETASYDAQQGHTAGANVNVTMKGGTNKLRGSLYEFYRSDSLNANDFFLNRAGRPRAPMSYNRFGASIGGPLTLPGYNGKDRTFFFLAYEGLPDEFPEPNQYNVPTEAMRRGDFSALLSQGIVIYNPFSGVRRADGRIERLPFPGNIIPANLINPVATAYLNFYPSPNQPGDAQGRNNYISSNPRTDKFHTLSGRFDHRLSDRNRFFVRYSWNNRRESRNNWAADTGGLRGTGNYLFRVNHNFIYDHIYTRNASTLFNLRVGFARFEEPNVRQHQGLFDAKTLGFSSRTSSLFGEADYLPRLDIGGMDSLGDSVGDAQYTNNYSVQPTLTKIMGRHSLKGGYDFRIYRNNRINPGHSAGQYVFNADFTRGPLDNSPGASIGQQFGSFLLGLPTGGVIDRNASRANQNLYHGLFIQDDWKLNDKLTLNLGLRYEYETPTTERYDRNIGGFDPTLASPIAQQAQAAYAARPIPELPPSSFAVRGGLTYLSKDDRYAWQADKNNIQPRFGFAYQWNDKTVLRGGWAIYTVPHLPETFNQSGFSQSTSIVPSLDGGLTFRASFADPFPDGVTESTGSARGAATFLGQTLGGDNAHVFLPGQVRKNSQSMRWSVGFQRELPGQWVFEAAYVGSRGYDLVVSVANDGNNTGSGYLDINAVPRQYLSTSPVRDDAVNNFLTTQVPNPFQNLIPGTGLNGASVARSQLLRPFPQFSSVRTERRDGTSMYHAGQFRLEKRFTGNYTIMLGYTYSRFMDKTILLNPSDTVIQSYVSPNDIPHRLTGSLIWQLPFGKGRRFDLGGAGNAVLGGWSMQGIYNWQSGLPLSFGNRYYNGDPTKLKSDYRNGPDGVFDTSGFYFSDAAVQTNGVVDPAKQRADTRIRLVSNVRTFPFRLADVRAQNVSFFEFSMIKTIEFSKDVRMQLRFEAFNAFNSPIFQGASTDPTSSDFAKSTGQYNIPRNVQLGVKLFF